MSILLWLLIILLVVIFFSGIRIVRPTHRAIVERLGKYTRIAQPGFNWIFPIIYKIYYINTTEMMVDAEPQEIITNDNLNATVDAQVYFKVKMDDVSLKASQYNVYDYQTQIVSLARTTLRNIIGTLTLKSANSERDRINTELMKTLKDESKNWGIEVVRTELKEIQPPEDVQATMNKVVKAENEKVAATDFATAREIEADGIRRAKIKEGEGSRQFRILEAQGQAEAIKTVNESANKYFIGNAQILKRLEITADALRENSKIVVPTDSSLVNVIGEMAGVLPLKEAKK
jgi:regulator of protease activity HflC (stomatin/prohibitin superfamily)